MTASRSAITSRVTVQNPRPRKYASAAEKQAAFRARFPTICVRVEPKTADTIQKIGDASGRSQQETMLSLVKFALTNRDFVNLGLTEHKQLPRIEEPRKANPMKRKPTPAQIAARERFAEMARSGAFKRNPAKKRSSQSNAPMPGDKTVYKRYTIIHPTSGQWFYIVRDGVNIGSARSVQEAKSLIDMLTEGLPNPAKKTVSQKISQLTREGYPQKQAVAIALSEERAGKVKRNPASNRYELRRMTLRNNLDSAYATLAHAKSALDEIDRPPVSFYVVDTETGKHYFSFQAHTVLPEINKTLAASMEKSYKSNYLSNPRASNPIILVSDRKPASKRKANPVKPKKQRMLNISWVTAGGQRDMKSVPIEFVFTHYVGNVAERFFVRTENGQLIVSEYSTGGRIGQVPYTMRAAALNDREAAKRFVGEMLSRIGAERFKAAVKQFEPIN